jgi:pimeloyl-ACP methyl ester carboxylesterase
MLKFVALGLTVLLGACTVFKAQPPIGPNPGASGGAGLRVGSVLLRPCLSGGYFCGSVTVPFDPARKVRKTIDIALAWLPHANRGTPSAGTIVAVEGGPGYPSIGSRSIYRQLYAPLLDAYDMLLVDNRGTGRSAAVVCRPLQHAPLMKLRDVTSCGRRLGRTSDLYGTALAADDLAAVLSALRIHKVEIYGDSYGSFFVQAFAGRHPKHVASVVLDGAYEVTGGNPWYPSTGPTLRHAFNVACRRSPVCAGLPGSSVSRIRELLVALRGARPRITTSQVAFVMDSAGLDPLAFRDLDAAARAYLARDPIPLERLVGEAYAEEEGAGRARGYSQGLFVAASCSDNPQVYDMRLPPAQRKAAWRRALERRRITDPKTYGPFTIDEFLAIPIDYAYVSLCTTWPVPSRRHPPGEPVPPGTQFPGVPVLVLNGDLDTITTPAEGERAAQLFPHATHVIVANTGHVTALYDFYGCASSIVLRFVRTQRVDARCAAAVPALHLVPSFARRLDGVVAASPLKGNRATAKQLRAAAAAALAAADVLQRSYEFGLTQGAGLRGGSYSAMPANATDRASLDGIRWVEDLAVSGTARFDARSASARASLTLTGASRGEVDAAWPTSGSRARAELQGTIDGYRLHATMPAP